MMVGGTPAVDEGPDFAVCQVRMGMPARWWPKAQSSLFSRNVCGTDKK